MDELVVFASQLEVGLIDSVLIVIMSDAEFVQLSSPASHCITLHHQHCVSVSHQLQIIFHQKTKHSDAARVVTMSFNCFITVVKTQEQICESNRDVGTDIDSLHHICSCLTDCNINNESETQFLTNILTHSSRTRNHKYLFPILLHRPHQLVCPDYLL